MKNSTIGTERYAHGNVPVDADRPLQKIAYIVSMFPCWSETFIAEEIKHLVDASLDIEIVSLKPASEDKVHQLSVELLPLVHYPGSAFGVLRSHLWFLVHRPIRYFGQLFNVVRYSGGHDGVKCLATFALAAHFALEIEESGVKRIHAHWATYPATAAWTVHRLTGVPFGFTTHAHDLYRPDRLLPEKIADADLVVTISEYNRNILNKICSNSAKIHVVHCGLDLQRFPPIKNYCWDDHRLVSVGRLVATKGFDVLIEACSILKRRGLYFNCEIVGDGQLRDELQRIIDRLGVGDFVQLSGFATQDAIRGKLNACMAFVLPCQETQTADVMDGIPVALMEAMAMSLPVVSTYVSGIPELITDHVSGLLVPPGNALRLADAITQLLTNRALCTRLGSNAHTTIGESFDISLSAHHLAKLFGAEAI